MFNGLEASRSDRREVIESVESCVLCCPDQPASRTLDKYRGDQAPTVLGCGSAWQDMIGPGPFGMYQHHLGTEPTDSDNRLTVVLLLRQNGFGYILVAAHILLPRPPPHPTVGDEVTILCEQLSPFPHLVSNPELRIAIEQFSDHLDVVVHALNRETSTMVEVKAVAARVGNQVRSPV